MGIAVAYVCVLGRLFLGFETFSSPTLPGVEFLTYFGCYAPNAHLIYLDIDDDSGNWHPQPSRSSAKWRFASAHNRTVSWLFERTGRSDCPLHANVDGAFETISRSVEDAGHVSVLAPGAGNRRSLVFRVALKNEKYLRQTVTDACRALEANHLLPNFGLTVGVGDITSDLPVQRCLRED